MRKLPGRDSVAAPLPINTTQSQWFDLLRILLLAQVILGHIGAVALPTVPQMMHGATPMWGEIGFRLITRFGREAAYVFVLLSGFFVGGPLLSGEMSGSRVSFNVFLRKRVMRIVPTLGIALVVTAIADWLGKNWLHLHALYAQYSVSDLTVNVGPRIFLANLLCLQPTLVPSYGSNGPLWTVGYIVQFYCAGYVLYRCWFRSNLLRILAIVALCAAGAVRPEWAELFLVWIAGSIARLWSPRVSTWWAGVAGIAVFVIADRTAAPFAIALSCVAGLFLTYSVLGVKRNVFESWVGAMSRMASGTYAAYASHFPVIFLLSSVLFQNQVRSMRQLCLLLGADAVAICGISLVVLRVSDSIANRFRPQKVSIAKDVRSEAALTHWTAIDSAKTSELATHE